MGHQLTEAEKTFLRRMVPAVMAGATLEEAGRAVLARDEELWLAAIAKDDQGQAIRDSLCYLVYKHAKGLR